MTDGPRIISWLDGLPEVESLFPLHCRLNSRGRVTAKPLISRRLLWREPRLRALFRHHKFAPQPIGKLRRRYFFTRDVRSAQGVVTLTDPTQDRSKKAARTQRALQNGKPIIFLQHGAVQTGVNFGTPVKTDFGADRLLLWQIGDAERKVLPPSTLDRAVEIGFTKPRLLPPRRPMKFVRDWLTTYCNRILLCHSFRWEGARFQPGQVSDFYDTLRRFLEVRPQTGVILRSHRGKTRNIHSPYDRALERRFDNLLISRLHGGPLKGNTIHDDLDLVHAVVSPVSTVVLDSIYAGRHVAVWAEADKGHTVPETFDHLPKVAGLASLLAFADEPTRSAPTCRRLRTVYGDIDRNLSKASEIIENQVLNAAEGASA